MYEKEKSNILFVAGEPGAGKSTALNVLEDVGYLIIDRIPTEMIPSLLENVVKKNKNFKLAIGLDLIRERKDEKNIRKMLDTLNESHSLNVKFLFLICGYKELLRRYTVTRRTHPLMNGETSLKTAIEKSKKIVQSYSYLATNVIDTSELNSSQLAFIIKKIFASKSDYEMKIILTSFSYRNGLPQEADIVIDVRCLRNPFYVKELKHLTGKNEKAAEYIKNDEDYEKFINALKNMLMVAIPKYKAEGKAYLNIAFGCTGGQHRSVCITEEIAKWLKNEGYQCSVCHRELEEYNLDESKNLK